MQISNYQRIAISMPAGMASQIDEACQREGRNRSEFFREAVRHYLSARLSSTVPQFVMPPTKDENVDDPFRLFAEWNSDADAVYDTLR
jgi:Arc/MetJ-type ribon-helix-helix transcriptional regulator